MRRTPTSRTPLRARLLVLLCCVLSVTAGLDGCVSLAFDAGPYSEGPGPSLTEQDPPAEDDATMLAPAGPEAACRDERKQDRPVIGCGRPEAHPGRLPPASAARTRLLPHPAGSEHAHRNGVGAPLLC
jgi:hypothetical protein